MPDADLRSRMRDNPPAIRVDQAVAPILSRGSDHISGCFFMRRAPQPTRYFYSAVQIEEPQCGQTDSRNVSPTRRAAFNFSGSLSRSFIAETRFPPRSGGRRKTVREVGS